MCVYVSLESVWPYYTCFSVSLFDDFYFLVHSFFFLTLLLFFSQGWLSSDIPGCPFSLDARCPWLAHVDFPYGSGGCLPSLWGKQDVCWCLSSRMKILGLTQFSMNLGLQSLHSVLLLGRDAAFCPPLEVEKGEGLTGLAFLKVVLKSLSLHQEH